MKINRYDLDDDYLRLIAHLITREYLLIRKLKKGSIDLNTSITFTFDLSLHDWNESITYVQLRDEDEILLDSEGPNETYEE